MSSIRVAVKPRATNSSSAASMMAPRRSAARSARLEASALGDAGLDDAGLDALAGAAFSPGRPAAAFAPPRPLADFDLGPDRVSDMREYMTDWSVIVNWTEGNDCHVAVTETERKMDCFAPLAMTSNPNTTSRSRDAMRPRFAFIFRPLEGVGNAGCPLHPRPRVQL